MCISTIKKSSSSNKLLKILSPYIYSIILKQLQTQMLYTMKTQKIIFSAVLVFAGILLFAKTTRLTNTHEEDTTELKTEVEHIKAMAALQVVWHDKKGKVITKELSNQHNAVADMPYAKKEQYTYNFETKTVSKKLYAQIDLKKVWNFKATK